MTRNEHELIAKSIRVDRETLDPQGKAAVDYIAAGLSLQLEAINPKRFKRREFLEACGYGEK